MTTLTVIQSEFAAGHLYRQKNWSAEKNAAVFGKCFSTHGHGHNYRFEVGFATGPHSAPRAELSEAVTQVCSLLDHKHLNFDVAEFKDKVPTTENISLYLLKKLQQRCPTEEISYIKLFETDNLWVEISL